MEKLDIETIGKHGEKKSVTLMSTLYKTKEDESIPTDSYLDNNDDIIPILIRKINELVDRINDFHGINEKK